MKLMRVFFAITILLSVVTIAQNKKDDVKGKGSVVIKTENDSASYAIGQNIAMQLKSLDLNMDLVTKSILDGSQGKSVLTQDELMRVLSAFSAKMQAKQAEMQKQQEEAKTVSAAKNKEEGEKFLAENKTKEGVKVTPSGLQYKVLKLGTGTVSPKDTNVVKVHYAGRLLNGQEFDSSIKRGEPSQFPLNGVIKGWTEGVQLMHVGDKFEFYIPSDLAYGDNGAGQIIGPGATLIFEVELIDIVK